MNNRAEDLLENGASAWRAFTEEFLSFLYCLARR